MEVASEAWLEREHHVLVLEHRLRDQWRLKGHQQSRRHTWLEDECV
jgi:hypothetical protein